MYVKILKNVAGITLVGFGIIGLFVPILQGVLMIIGGLLLLGVKKEQIRKWFRKIKF